MPITELRFISTSTGQRITPATAHEIHDDDIDDVTLEVGQALSGINAQLKSAAGTARTTGRYLMTQEWAVLQERRAFLASLHQQLSMQRGKKNKEEREKRHAETMVQMQSEIRDASYYFQQVVRNEASVTDYQRWVLQAEMRRNADVARLR